MGQGFFGYNPPPFILNAAKAALDKVDCNQYSPTKGRPRLKKAIADAYSPFWGRQLNPETEVTITTGANEGTGWSSACAPSAPYLHNPCRNAECFHGFHRAR
jgi:aspartate/methionine/tyrosine aminotransferase